MKASNFWGVLLLFVFFFFVGGGCFFFVCLLVFVCFLNICAAEILWLDRKQPLKFLDYLKGGNSNSSK